MQTVQVPAGFREMPRQTLELLMREEDRQARAKRSRRVLVGAAVLGGLWLWSRRRNRSVEGY